MTLKKFLPLKPRQKSNEPQPQREGQVSLSVNVWNPMSLSILLLHCRSRNVVRLIETVRIKEGEEDPSFNEIMPDYPCTAPIPTIKDRLLSGGCFGTGDHAEGA